MKTIRMVVLLIPGDIGELTPNRRLHHRTKAAKIKRWREATAWIAEQDHGSFKAKRVRLNFTIFRWRKLDHAQLHGTLAIKAAEDGLVDAGLIPDDAPQYVEWGSIQQTTGSQWRFRECLRIAIEVLEECP